MELALIEEVRELAVARRFEIADLSTHGPWLLKRFATGFPDFSEKQVAGYLSGLVYDNEHLFSYQDNAVALAQLIHSPGINDGDRLGALCLGGRQARRISSNMPPISTVTRSVGDGGRCRAHHCLRGYRRAEVADRAAPGTGVRYHGQSREGLMVDFAVEPLMQSQADIESLLPAQWAHTGDREVECRPNWPLYHQFAEHGAAGGDGARLVNRSAMRRVHLPASERCG